ncbi:hypothetical protein D0T53_10950 [Dysgonomonas sp. 216]|uniref:hypothetical protein n=1 Tax=Dysgonomonas sp. 216 TaxID=2302934 RepID=UPI0013CF4BE8|nr:hypothetical protein [Dysgonomonas sp. 216]NDW19422.1 hypothetical protein [Dysgonomonas sp. 216]
MAGAKGKSGLKPGQTNNKAGRKKGSKNKVSAELKVKITDVLDGNVSILENALKDEKTPIYLRGKLYVEASKLVVPKPVSDEEQDNANILMGGLAHLFGKPKEE